jgi:hypothetical protein
VPPVRMFEPPEEELEHRAAAVARAFRPDFKDKR